jgi:hypothetical protein
MAQDYGLMESKLLRIGESMDLEQEKEKSRLNQVTIMLEQFIMSLHMVLV